jgi:hypothetical protein
MAWQIGEVSFWNGSERVHVGGPYQFTSAWMSAGGGEQWVSVDLGAKCKFDRIVLSWIRRAATGEVQVSDDQAQWRALAPLSAANELKVTGEGRYLRVLMTKPSSPDGYVLTELEVFGTGGMIATPKPPPAQKGNRLDLAGGAWKVQRDSQVEGDGTILSRPGFADSQWIAATVPATVLASYFNAGALPDPNFGDNQLMISDSFFYADFWYRTEFARPVAGADKKVWLNFDGINWKADVFLNGEKLGGIEGAFTRARFDVTERLRDTNALAVRIIKNATPGSIK